MLGSFIRLHRSIIELLGEVREDWTVNRQDWTLPGLHAIAVHRLGRWASARRSGIPKSVLLFFYRVLFCYVRNCYGIEIPLEVKIGRRLELDHQSGIVFHWKAEVGDDCVIRHNVTIGADYGGPKNLHRGPKLGNRVHVSPGAVIFAGVKIGDDVMIGPNVVVTTNILPGMRLFVEAPRSVQLQPNAPGV